MKIIPGIIIILSLLFSAGGSYGQVFENDDAAREKHFIYEVKQIDEFFERFNNDTSSFIRKVYKQKNVVFRLERPALIKSLFNTVSRAWRAAEVDSFIIQALATEMPSRRNFYGEDWFAEAICNFEFKGSVLSIPVILQIHTDKDKRSKWMIAAIRQNNIKANSPVIAGGDSVSTNYFISPASHGNYFIELEKVFDDKSHLLSYFDPTIVRKSQSVTFYNAILKNQVKFLHVKEIKYHFLQVSGYVFTVENFQRDALNSGWLISQLRIVSPAEKATYRRTLLGE